MFGAFGNFANLIFVNNKLHLFSGVVDLLDVGFEAFDHFGSEFFFWFRRVFKRNRSRRRLPRSPVCVGVYCDITRLYQPPVISAVLRIVHVSILY